MKIKQFLVVTDIDKFAASNYSNCFSLFERDTCLPKDWVVFGEIEIDMDQFDVSIDDVIANSASAIQAKIERETKYFNQKMERLRKQADLIRTPISDDECDSDEESRDAIAEHELNKFNSLERK